MRSISAVKVGCLGRKAGRKEIEALRLDYVGGWLYVIHKFEGFGGRLLQDERVRRVGELGRGCRNCRHCDQSRYVVKKADSIV